MCLKIGNDYVSILSGSSVTLVLWHFRVHDHDHHRTTTRISGVRKFTFLTIFPRMQLHHIHHVFISYINFMYYPQHDRAFLCYKNLMAKIYRYITRYIADSGRRGQVVDYFIVSIMAIGSIIYLHSFIIYWCIDVLMYNGVYSFIPITLWST